MHGPLSEAPVDPQAASQERVAFGRRASQWIQAATKMQANASKELEAGNMGPSATQLVGLLQQMPESDWFKFFFGRS